MASARVGPGLVEVGDHGVDGPRRATHEGVAAWVAQLSASGLSASTVRQAHRVLSLVLTLGVRDGRLARNPADHVPLRRAGKRERDFLTMEQVDQLADAAGDYRAAIFFLAYTGVRFGELAALCVRRLDLLRRRAEIVEAVAEVRGRAVFSTRRPNQVRTVPIPRFVVEDIAQLTAKAPDDFVFAAPKGGGLLRLQNFRHVIFERAIRSAGLDGLTPHALRHTAASLAIAAGADVKVVQQMLGHASATMTLDLYGHLYGDRLDEVADKMDAARALAKWKQVDPGSVVRLSTRRALAHTVGPT